MIVQETASVPQVQNATASDRWLWGTFAVFLLCYSARCIWAAIWTPLWLDEVLSVWAIRLHSAKEIWSAIQHGSEFAPPTYPLLLHYYSLLAGDSYLALRFVSLAAAAVFAACCFILFRRYLGLAAAILGCCIILEGIRLYALQVRPYCCSVAFFGLALVFWDDLSDSRKKGRNLLICFCLAGATAFHFYSVLFIPCLALIELLRYLRTREVRVGLWAALFVAGLATFVWLPLIHTLSAYNKGDTGSPAYYGKPKLGRLMASYLAMFAENYQVLIFIFSAALAIASVRFVRPTPPLEKTPKAGSDFWAVAIGVSLLPLIVFAFSLAVTKTYNNRYIIASAFGLTACVVGAFSSSPYLRKAVPFAVVLGALLTTRHPTFTYGTFERDPVYRELTGGDPIVVSDVQQFFTLKESAPMNIRPRLVYLRLPAGTSHPDPTVVNQLMRWKAIDPGLPVVDAEEFLTQHKSFYVVDTHSGIDDSPLNYLLDRHAIQLVHQFDDGSVLFKSNL